MRPLILPAGVLMCATLSIFASSGCDAVEEVTSDIDELTDCDSVCDRYADCYDSSYDTSACRSRCEGIADDNANFSAKLDTCEECMDDTSCAEATFNCDNACENVVP